MKQEECDKHKRQNHLNKEIMKDEWHQNERLVKKEKFCQGLLRQNRKMQYKNITGKGSVISDSTEILKTMY